MAIVKQYNWHQDLTDLINARQDQPFMWGSNDCALWGADCVNTITGTDFAANIRGTYTDALGAYKALVKEYNVDNVKQIFAQILGDEQPIFYARQGDIVYQTSNYEGFNAAIGICNGEQSYFLHDPEDEVQGLFKVPTLSCDGCFWVG